MNIIQNILKEEIKTMVNNHSQYLRIREKTTPESYYKIDDESEDGYVTSYYIEEEFDYLEAKAKRNVNFNVFAIDPKWRPSKGFSDLYSLTGKIIKNTKAIELFMLEPQTDKQKYIKQRLLEWFKIAKGNNELNLIPFLVQLVEINKNYQMQKRAQG